MDELLKNRICELSSRCSGRGIYTFGDFLSPSDIAEAKKMRLAVRPSFYGGAEECERMMIGFGSEEELGYKEDFPIAVAEISAPKKFAQKMTHRDFLGAILALGIERSKVGDIFTDGYTAYLMITDGLLTFVLENLTRVGRSAVTVKKVDTLPEGFYPKTEERTVNVNSVRLDAIICRLYNLSRGDGAELIKRGLVFVCGEECTSSGYAPREGDAISVRGYGKFIFLGESGSSARGRLFVKLKVYI